MRLLRIFLLPVFIMSFSGGAFAEPYYWMASKYAWPFQMPNGDKKVASPGIACYYSSPNYPTSRAEYVSDDLYKCYIDGHGYVTSAIRYTCPAGTMFNSDSGECEPEEPEEPDQCEAGNEIMRATYAVFGGSPNPPSLICSSSCEYNFKHLSGVGMNNPDKPDVFKYNAMYMSNGNNCESETPPEIEPDQPPPEPDPPKPGDPDYCPPGFSKGPDGSTCFRDPDNPDPGGDGGGSGPGDGGGSGPGDGGGSGPGDGGGSGPGDGGGSGPGGGGGSGPGGGGGTGPGDGGGSGPGDGGGSGPGGTGGTGGTGGGKGDGEGEEEGEGEYKPGQGDSVCESKPECSGDPIQCGIVDQQWRARCDAEKAGDFPGQKDAIREAVTGPQFGLLEAGGDIQVPSFIEGHARWLPGSTCPPDEKMSLRLAGGRTFTLSYQPLCTAATTISPLLVVIATVLAGLYIGRASGD